MRDEECVAKSGGPQGTLMVGRGQSPMGEGRLPAISHVVSPALTLTSETRASRSFWGIGVTLETGGHS